MKSRFGFNLATAAKAVGAFEEKNMFPGEALMAAMEVAEAMSSSWPPTKILHS
jgi:hypothetical protein